MDNEMKSRLAFPFCTAGFAIMYAKKQKLALSLVYQKTQIKIAPENLEGCHLGC